MSSKVAVHPEGAAPPRGSLSKGIVAGGFLFTSGTVAFHPETGEIVGDTVGGQTRQALENLAAILAATGLTLDDVVKTTVHLTDPVRDFAEFDAAYLAYFDDPRPVRTTVGSTLAVKGLLVEIDLIAVLR